MVSGEGILGLRKIDPVKFCPECLSVKIKMVNYPKAVSE